MKRLWFWITTVTFIAAAPVHAHSLGAECRIRDGKVEVEAFFSDDTIAEDALVRVVNGEKLVVATGRTDKSGKYAFAIPPAGRYQVIVDAGDGHRTTRAFEIAQGVLIAQEIPKSPERQPATPDKVSGGGAIIVSEGPTRQEFTSFPWLQVAIGLAAIAAFCAAFMIARRLR